MRYAGSCTRRQRACLCSSFWNMYTMALLSANGLWRNGGWRERGPVVRMANKVIPSNYPSISHLPGSKLRDKSDRTIGEQEATWLTVQTRHPDDLVVVTEKVDGCNVGAFGTGIAYENRREYKTQKECLS